MVNIPVDVMNKSWVIRSSLDFIYGLVIISSLAVNYVYVFKIKLPIKWEILGTNVLAILFLMLIYEVIYKITISFYWKHPKFIELYLKLNSGDIKARLKLGNLLTDELQSMIEQENKMNDALKEMMDSEAKLLEFVDSMDDYDGIKKSETIKEAKLLQQKIDRLTNKRDQLFVNIEKLHSKIKDLIEMEDETKIAYEIILPDKPTPPS